MTKDTQLRVRLDPKTDLALERVAKRMKLNRSVAVRSIISEKCWELNKPPVEIGGDDKTLGATTKVLP